MNHVNPGRASVGLQVWDCLRANLTTAPARNEWCNLSMTCSSQQAYHSHLYLQNMTGLQSEQVGVQGKATSVCTWWTLVQQDLMTSCPHCNSIMAHQLFSKSQQLQLLCSCYLHAALMPCSTHAIQCKPLRGLGTLHNKLLWTRLPMNGSFRACTAES